MNAIESATKVIDCIAEKTDSAMLMCSLGKDSIVTLDLMYPKFKRIICVFMYFVKGLEHIERWVRWVQAKYPKVDFVQIPHWNLTYLLRGGLYSVPNPSIKLMKLSDVIRSLRIQYDVYYTFLGMKKADGMNRNLMLKGYELKGYENDGLVYPLADWNQKTVLAYMRQHRLPEPVRYSLKASSGIGFNLDCMLWLEKYCPGDLQKIYEVFPMSERVLYEHNYKLQKQSEEDTNQD